MDRLDALKVFCAVVETGGFRKAADKLGISTPSVTNQIVALETHFNIKLLNRTTRSMSMTDEGRQCYEQALRLLGDMSELETSLQVSNKTPRGSLWVDLPSGLSRLYVAPALPRFLKAYPEITLKMTVSDRMIDMVEEGVDVLVRIGQLQDSGMIAKKIAATQFVCCASPAFLKKHGRPKTPDDLARFTCLNFLYPKSRQVRPWIFQKDGAPFSQTPQGVLGMDHVESLIEAAKAGCGIVQQMSVSLAEPIRSGALEVVLPDWRAAGPDVSVLFHPRHQRAAKVKVFVDFLQTCFEKV
jgi:LysR family transcriptional regulator for bpeEF and oprC